MSTYYTPLLLHNNVFFFLPATGAVTNHLEKHPRQLRGCSVQQDLSWIQRETNCHQHLWISCSSFARLTSWASANFPGNKNLVSPLELVYLQKMNLKLYLLRERVKYYFADFVRKGGGVPPKSVTPFSLKKKSVKGGRGVPPKSVTYFWTKIRCFLGPKTQFLALFEEKFSGKKP